MKEQKIIRVELLKNMLFNLILLTLIVSTFSIFILNQFNNYLYKSVDKEILQYKQQLEDISDFVIKDEKTLENSNSIDDEELSDEELTSEVQKNIDKIANPRVVTILRDDKGDVIATSLSVKYFADYIGKSDFNKTKLGEIYEIKVNGKYFYRATTCKLTASNGDTYFIDVLININSEKEMTDNFTRTLTIGTGIVVILSIFISLYLSKRAMEPIIQAYKKQAEFVQNASHELRTPLTIIQAKQEMLLQSPESKIIDKSEDIALSLNETRRLSKMITELMDLARSDANRAKINKVKTNMEEVAKEVIIPYKEMAELQNKKMTLEIKCDRELNVDKNKIKQLLVILLDNAIKYTEENDTIDIDIHNHEDKLFINVKDTGIGISDEGLKHIFERFYREDKARSRASGGTGLGLAIAHTIVKNHGGSIKLVHNKPKGTHVIVKI